MHMNKDKLLLHMHKNKDDLCLHIDKYMCLPWSSRVWLTLAAAMSVVVDVVKV